MPTLFVICGLPFSGKTYLSKKLAEKLAIKRISYDDLWKEINQKESRDPSWEELCSIVESQIADELKAGRSVIYDTLNDTVGNREKLRKVAQGSNGEAIVVYADTPLDLIHSRRKENITSRDRLDVLEINFQVALNKFEVPNASEVVYKRTPEQEINAWLDDFGCFVESHSREFREKLTEMIEGHATDWWKPKEFEENIRPILPKSLEIISPPPQYEQNYNCFVFAFGLEKDSDFLGGNNPVQQEFIKFLITKKGIVSTDKPIAGDLAFYRNSKTGEISHGGIMKDKDVVISKWMWGPTIAHKLWDVQSSFGDEVLYFKSVAPNEIKSLYEAYKATGVEIKPIE